MSAESDRSTHNRTTVESRGLNLTRSHKSSTGYNWSANVVETSILHWSRPSMRVRSQASRAAWWGLNHNWSNDFSDNRSNDFSYNGDNSKSGDFSISLSFDPLESVVLHDEEGDFGHALGEDVLAVDVDAVVEGGDGHGAGNEFLLFNNLDDFLGHVVDLGRSLDDLPGAAEVEAVGDHVGAVASPAGLVEVGVVQLVVGPVQVVVGRGRLGSSALRGGVGRVDPGWMRS